MFQAQHETFREELAIKYPAFGYALWEPGSRGRYHAVQVGDVGFFREGYFHQLFNVLHPTSASGDGPCHPLCSRASLELASWRSMECSGSLITDP